jgi:hypothetical protein
MYVFYIQDDSSGDYCVSNEGFREDYHGWSIEEEIGKKKASISRHRNRYPDDMPEEEDGYI